MCGCQPGLGLIEAGQPATGSSKFTINPPFRVTYGSILNRLLVIAVLRWFQQELGGGRSLQGAFSDAAVVPTARSVERDLLVKLLVFYFLSHFPTFGHVSVSSSIKLVESARIHWSSRWPVWLTFGQTVSCVELDAEAEAVEVGSGGVIVFDGFQGNRTPHTDSRARGAVWGLSLGSSRAHMYRGMLEVRSIPVMQAPCLNVLFLECV